MAREAVSQNIKADVRPIVLCGLVIDGEKVGIVRVWCVNGIKEE